MAKRIGDDDLWEPYDFQLRVYVSRSMSFDLDMAASELRLSKSLLVREAVRRGLPLLVADVEHLRERGFRSARHLAGLGSAVRRSGLAGDGPVSARWSKRPADFVEEPQAPGPVEDED